MDYNFGLAQLPAIVAVQLLAVQVAHKLAGGQFHIQLRHQLQQVLPNSSHRCMLSSNRVRHGIHQLVILRKCLDLHII
jgi:hypothetical protein